MKTRYITTDLLLVTSIDIAQFIKLEHFDGDWYERRNLLIHNYKGDDNMYYVSVRQPDNFGATIEKEFPVYIKFLTKLFSNKKVSKKKFKKIDFDMGFDAGDEGPEWGFKIPNKFFEKIADLSATITITIYPYDISNEIDLDENSRKKTKKVIRKKGI